MIAFLLLRVEVLFSSPISLSSQQEDVVKLTEKCALNSTGSSPAITPLCVPEELKSNILKAQAEAAALKVRNRASIKRNALFYYNLNNCQSRTGVRCLHC